MGAKAKKVKKGWNEDFDNSHLVALPQPGPTTAAAGLHQDPEPGKEDDLGQQRFFTLPTRDLDLGGLADDCWTHIFTFLRFKDLFTVCETKRIWRILVDSEQLLVQSLLLSLGKANRDSVIGKIFDFPVLAPEVDATYFPSQELRDAALALSVQKPAGASAEVIKETVTGELEPSGEHPHAKDSPSPPLLYSAPPLSCAEFLEVGHFLDGEYVEREEESGFKLANKGASEFCRSVLFDAMPWKPVEDLGSASKQQRKSSFRPPWLFKGHQELCETILHHPRYSRAFADLLMRRRNREKEGFAQLFGVIEECGETFAFQVGKSLLREHRTHERLKNDDGSFVYLSAKSGEFTCRQILSIEKGLVCDGGAIAGTVWPGGVKVCDSCKRLRNAIVGSQIVTDNCQQDDADIDFHFFQYGENCMRQKSQTAAKKHKGSLTGLSNEVLRKLLPPSALAVPSEREKDPTNAKKKNQFQSKTVAADVGERFAALRFGAFARSSETSVAASPPLSVEETTGTLRGVRSIPVRAHRGIRGFTAMDSYSGGRGCGVLAPLLGLNDGVIRWDFLRHRVNAEVALLKDINETPLMLDTHVIHWSPFWSFRVEILRNVWSILENIKTYIERTHISHRYRFIKFLENRNNGMYSREFEDHAALTLAREEAHAVQYFKESGDPCSLDIPSPVHIAAHKLQENSGPMDARTLRSLLEEAADAAPTAPPASNRAGGRGRGRGGGGNARANQICGRGGRAEFNFHRELAFHRQILDEIEASFETLAEVEAKLLSEAYVDLYFSSETDAVQAWARIHANFYHGSYKTALHLLGHFPLRSVKLQDSFKYGLPRKDQPQVLTALRNKIQSMMEDRGGTKRKGGVEGEEQEEVDVVLAAIQFRK